MPHEIIDAEQRALLLESITSLPDRARRELAEAYRSAAIVRALHERGCAELAGDEAYRSLEILARWLGAGHPEVARSLLALATSLDASSDHLARERLLIGALASLEKHLGAAHPAFAEALAAMGKLRVDQGRYAEGESLLRQSLDLRVHVLGEEHPDTAAGLNLMGVVRSEQGDYESAERFYRDALTLRRRLLGEERHEVVQSLTNLAHLLELRARFSEAEALLRQALTLRRRQVGDRDPRVAVILNNLASVLQNQGDYASAEELNRQALARRVELFGATHPNVATTTNNLGYIRMMRGDHEEAERLYRAALEVRRERLGEEHPQTAVSRNNVAYMSQLRGDYEGAEALYRLNLSVYRKTLGDKHPSVARTLFNLAEVLRKQGDLDPAEAAYRESLLIRRQSLKEWHLEQVRNHVKLGILLLERGDVGEAEATFITAAEAYEEGRRHAGAGIKRATFQNSPYLWLAAVRFARGDGAGGWEALEHALARTLSEQIADEKRQSLSLERVQATLRPRSALMGWLDVELRPGCRMAWGYALRHSGPIGLSQLEPVANAPSHPPSGAGDERQEQRDPAAVSRGPRRFREQIIRAGHGALGASASDDWRVEARRLWLERIAPIAGALEGTDELIVVPSGAMSSVPVETLIDDRGRLVGDCVAVSYVPSATIHARLSESRSRVPAGERTSPGSGPMRARSLLLGDPPYCEAHLRDVVSGAKSAGAGTTPVIDRSTLRNALEGDEDALAGLPRLRWSRQEVRHIADLLESPTIMLGPRAAYGALDRLVSTDGLESFRTIHFATHALVDEDRPERSALVLALVGDHDTSGALEVSTHHRGLLRAGEIAGKWRLAADLVTLSACETGLGREVTGEGTVGLAHTFLGVGARCVLVSLWKVDDRATCLLMHRFYENWTGRREQASGGGGTGEAVKSSPGMTKVDALREAKRWLREYRDARGRQPYRHPFYWSSFVLLGDAR